MRLEGELAREDAAKLALVLAIPEESRGVSIRSWTARVVKKATEEAIEGNFKHYMWKKARAGGFGV